MTFLHPQLLYLAPLAAAPILIHLLNRVRYRRVRWAAIDFLLSSERRAVRRARLRQILLMILRTLVLSAAILSLAGPVLRGGLVGLLGASPQVAVVLDASASLSAADPEGTAFERAKKLAAAALRNLPARSKALAGTFALTYESPFREPVQDHAVVASVVGEAQLTAGAGNVPKALAGAAEALRRAGGGGTIWLLTDLQADGWQVSQAGAWQQARDALRQAGKPRIVITDVGAKVPWNLSIARVRLTPGVLVEGDRPRLAATVALHGGQKALAQLSLSLDGQKIDSRPVDLAAPGNVEAVFHLPPLKGGVHWGCLRLDPDALPADDAFYFLLRTTQNVPVLLVDGQPSATPLEGAGDFIALAFSPPAEQATARSPFAVKKIPASGLSGAKLGDYKAVVLAGLTALDLPAAKQVRSYVEDGGLLFVFPGPRTGPTGWDEAGLAGVRFGESVEAPEDKAFKAGWVSPASPLTASLPGEGLDRLQVHRMFKLPDAGEVLLRAEGGLPLLLRLQAGKGKAYVFAVSGQLDFSNLPFTPVLLLALHRAMLSHLVESSDPPARWAFEELRVPTSATARIRTPDGRALPPVDAGNGQSIFAQTAQAGIYRLAEGTGPPEKDEPPLAAVNPPPEESSLDHVDADTIHRLLSGFSVSLAGPGTGGAISSEGATAGLSFPLSLAALLALLGEAALAWSIGRTGKIARDTAAVEMPAANARNGTR